MEDLSPLSLKRLNECHPDLQRIALAAVKLFEFQISCGYRNKEDQNKAFEEGVSKLQYPESKHNRQPSEAFDFVPFPFDYASLADPKLRERELGRLYYIAGIIRGVAHALGVKLRTGADWNNDGDPTNEKFKDLFHVELT